MMVVSHTKVHCPENIDRSSWGVMCKLRREKIRMEEDLRSLAKEVAEAEVIFTLDIHQILAVEVIREEIH